MASMKAAHWSMCLSFTSLLLVTTNLFVTEAQAQPATEPVVTLELAPSEANPRNSEGDFVRLNDGRILLVYTHFTGGVGDDAIAHLASRVSSDEGKTWSDQDRLVLANEGDENVMSVSMHRLDDGRIALFYLRKNSLDDCRPWIRFSEDEAETWSEPVEIIPDDLIGYYVVNNDRLVELESGRLIFPASRHNDPSLEKFSGQGVLVCFFSDDDGQTWQKSESEWNGTPAPDNDAIAGRTTLQEPGIVQRKDGSLLMFARTNGGSQFFSESNDDGNTWTRPIPSPLISPVSPATIERVPQTGELVAIWNDHSGIPKDLIGKRTPLSLATSPDDGKTWRPSRTLFDSPSGWYCYTALIFTDDDHLLLAHCAGDRTRENGLARTHVTRVPVSWLPGRP